MSRHFLRFGLIMLLLLGAKVHEAEGWYGIGLFAFIALAGIGLLALADAIEDRVVSLWREWRG